MKASIEVEGLGETVKALKKFGRDGIRETEKAVEESLHKVRTTSLHMIQRDPKSGRVYTQEFRMINGRVTPVGDRSEAPNLSSEHQASAPGEAPATDTGRLVTSIKVKRTGTEGTVGSQLDYAFYLEYGTLRMEPRPWLRPALRDNQGWIIERFQEALDTAARRFNG